jgi:16S rRNA (cytosine967-C5)-methyltransferase
VLRSIERGMDEIEYPDEDTPLGMSVKYSCPEWLAGQLMCELGPEYAHKILEQSLVPADIFIRTNLSRITPEGLTRKLEEEKVVCEPAPYLPYALKLTDIDSVSRINVFGVGFFQIQDIGSMLVTHLAGIKKGDVVFDVCASPGGKSMHALDILEGTGHLYAFDVSEKKLEPIAENAVRMLSSNIDVIKADATEYHKEYEEMADVLIADLPCSGLGVLGRRNDIKYNMTGEKETSLAKLQKEILANVSRYVKRGGYLIFSTCTVHRAENEDNVRWILDNLPFEPVSLDEHMPEELKCASSANGYIQLIPGVHKCDGFFISKFRKTGKSK